MPPSKPESVQQIKLTAIEPWPDQPRTEPVSRERLDELATSIKAHGVLQPVTVRLLSDSDRRRWPHMAEGAAEYVLVAGEQRWKAAGMAGLRTIPAIVRHYSDRQAFLVSLVENDQRNEITPIDAARSYAKAMSDNRWNVHELSTEIGRTASEINKRLRLLRIGEDIQEAVQPLTISSALEIEKVKAPNTRRRLIDEMKAGASYQNIKAQVQRSIQQSALAPSVPVVKPRPKHLPPPYDWDAAVKSLEDEAALMTDNLQTWLAVSAKRKKELRGRIEAVSQQVAEIEAAIQ